MFAYCCCCFPICTNHIILETQWHLKNQIYYKRGNWLQDLEGWGEKTKVSLKSAQVTVLGFLLLWGIKHHERKLHGKEGFISAPSLTPQSITEGSHSQSSNRTGTPRLGADAEVTEDVTDWLSQLVSLQLPVPSSRCGTPPPRCARPFHISHQ